MVPKVIVVLFLLNYILAQEPCTIINVKTDLIVKDVVNVIYMMDEKCDSCYHEAKYLPTLRSDMLSRGIVINPVIAINSKPIKVSTLAPGISVDSGNIWSALGRHNSHVFIIDRCNRLAYEVIMPWSLFKLPFVKAAILSTHHSDPCGACSSSVPGSSLQEKDNIAINIDGTAVIQYPAVKGKQLLNKALITEDDNIIPMRIIYKQPHTHRGDPKIYEHIEILADDPSYHYHPEDEKEDFFLTELNQEIKSNNLSKTITDELVSVNSVNENNDHSELIAKNSHQKNETMNKERLWSHYFKILFWIPHV